MSVTVNLMDLLCVQRGSSVLISHDGKGESLFIQRQCILLNQAMGTCSGEELLLLLLLSCWAVLGASYWPLCEGGGGGPDAAKLLLADFLP